MASLMERMLKSGTIKDISTLDNSMYFNNKDFVVTDLPLLNGVFGSTNAQITNETGTASWAAASMRDTSGQGYLGHERGRDENGLMKKLVGFESVDDAIELELR